MVDTYSIDESPFYKSWKDWNKTWCIWCFEQPLSSNPASDNTGQNCARKQTDPNVWFLAGTFGGSATRTCTIPAEKAIFFPIILKECSNVEFPAENDLANCASTGEMNSLTRNEATIDDVTLENSQKPRVKSDIFSLTFPDNAAFNAQPGPTQSVCDGYWVFLKPLPPGEHDVFFAAEHPEPLSSGGKFFVEVTYHLRVEKGVVYT